MLINLAALDCIATSTSSFLGCQSPCWKTLLYLVLMTLQFSFGGPVGERVMIRRCDWKWCRSGYGRRSCERVCLGQTPLPLGLRRRYGLGGYIHYSVYGAPRALARYI
ncbi:hypothetical protein F5X97DRAFT_311505 [Nemania serpens]|nr:hypothetical protein F5X97DRAFT_311505 [Nemania serpens]